ncbi:helix-turn-helix domain-containing protein [Streptococcus fryi]
MNRLKTLRKEYKEKLTQEELAKRIGVTKLTVSNWETGKHAITPEKAKLLANYFGVSVGYLLGFAVDEVSDEELVIHNNIMEMIEKTNFVRFLDYIMMSDFKLTDKQIEALFAQITSISDMNYEYARLEEDEKKYQSLFSLYRYYMPDKDYLRLSREIYQDEVIERQYKLIKKILGD